MEKLGYLVMKKIYVRYSGEEGFNKLIKEFTDPDECVYDITLLQHPEWLHSI